MFFMVLFWWSVCSAQPYQAVKWPTQYQVNKVASYKTVIEDESGTLVKEVVVETNAAKRGWIVDGVIQLQQSPDRRGVPVKIVCNYAEQNLEPGEYRAKVLACDANGLCSNPALSPIINLLFERERTTTIVLFEDGSSGNVVEHIERWKSKVIQPAEQNM